MSQISPELLLKAATAPQENFNVVITVTNGTLPGIPGLTGNPLMENIFNATASGAAIEAMHQMAEVVAVEPNYDMQAFQDEIVATDE
ncbi:MAG: hypothetical protein EAY75_09545 [Bacteroidetes bacterium]|nr:MAG: hypothetical protein EAY75_09545 [Bacteroidota bacterium]